MARAIWRILALLVVAIALWLSIRDFAGFSDAQPAAHVPYLGYNHLWGLVRLLSLGVAATLILKSGDRRPAQMLAGALVGLALNNNWWFYSLDNPLIRLSAVLNYIGIGFGLSQFVRFAACYGEQDFRYIRQLIAMLAPYIGAAATVFGLLWWLSVMDMRPYVAYNRLFWAAWDTANILTIVAAFIGWFRTPAGSDRTRMTWVALSFSLAAFGTALHGFDRALEHQDTVWVNYVDTILQLSLPVGLGYAILRYRLLDKAFVMQSALLYSLITVLLSAGEVLLERLTRVLVPEQGRMTANAAEFGLSLIVVVSYKRFERWADDWTERVFGESDAVFHAKLQHFRDDVLPKCDAPAQLEDKLLRELEGYSRMRSVALYRRSGKDLLKRMPPDTECRFTFAMAARRPLHGFVVCEFSEPPARADLEAIAETVTASGTVLEALENVRLEQRVRELEAKLAGKARRRAESRRPDV